MLQSLKIDGLKIVAVELPNDDEEVPFKTKLTLSGWGKTLNPSESERFLRAAEVFSENFSKCQNAWRKVGVLVTKRMACVDAQFKNACTVSLSSWNVRYLIKTCGFFFSLQNDSGGPVVVTGTKKLVGVISFGSKKCVDPLLPGVYAKVSSVRGWIDDIAGVWEFT